MRERTIQKTDQGKARVFFDLLAAEKKKGITAVCLLTVMTLMWARVFMGKSPRVAPADQVDQTSASGQFASETGSNVPGNTIRYIELPKIEGRNDRLIRDFFTETNDLEPSLVTTNTNGQPGNNMMIRRIASLLKLEAIVAGNSPQAFINNKIFKTGDTINISDKNVKFEGIIEKINETDVVISCLGTKIILKISNPLEVIE